VSIEDAKRFSEENKIDFFMEASGKSGENSTKVFIEAAKILHSDYVTNKNRRHSFSEKSAADSNFSEKDWKFNEMNTNRKEECRITDSSSSGKCLVF